VRRTEQRRPDRRSILAVEHYTPASSYGNISVSNRVVEVGKVAIQLTSGMDEEVSRFGGIGGPETDGACEGQSSVVLIGVVFLLQSIILPLRPI
jgi:hypothetical protein